LFGGTADGSLPASALLNGSTFPAAHGRPPRSAVRWSLELDPLNAALIELFAAHGWRLPDADGAHLTSIDAGAAGITLGWTADRASTPAPAGPPDDARFDGGDGLLGRGDVEGALAAYRRCVGAGDPGRAPDAAADPAAAARIHERIL